MYLIAEIGFNHDGDIDLAKKMICAAADAGADAVKFQTFKAKEIALPSSPHYALIEKGELSLKDHQILKKEATEHQIDFMSTPFGLEAVDLLTEVGVSAFKIASMDCTNNLLLERVALTGKPVYLSTGMASLAEIASAVDILNQNHCHDLTVLHCISHYPVKAEDLNLNMIPYLKEQLNLAIGYSDHYPGIEACFAATVLGADVIETHFTLDSSNPEGDHGHSATPEDLKELRTRVDLFQAMAGSGDAISRRPDLDCAKDFRRGAYTVKPLEKGRVIRKTDIQFTRPAADFSPNDLAYLTGKRLKINLPANAPLTRDALLSD